MFSHTIQSDYELNVISQHPDFKNKTFRKHRIQNQDYIGVFGDEPFFVQFKNNTHQMVQVKLSIDGTDTLTGEIASTELTNEMWVVQPYSNITIKAWKESEQGGAAFVFAHVDHSVAVHIHGDTSCRGIISAAVYVEGYKETVQITKEHHHYYPYYLYTNICYPYPNWWLTGEQIIPSQPYIYNGITTSDGGSFGDGSCSSINSLDTTNVGGLSTGGYCYLNNSQSQPAVGAGDFTAQPMTYVSGLRKPLFSTTVQIRYDWWDNVVAKLKDNHNEIDIINGFPITHHKRVDLSNVPKVATNKTTNNIQPNYARF